MQPLKQPKKPISVEALRAKLAAAEAALAAAPTYPERTRWRNEIDRLRTNLKFREG